MVFDNTLVASDMLRISTAMGERERDDGAHEQLEKATHSYFANSLLTLFGYKR